MILRMVARVVFVASCVAAFDPGATAQCLKPAGDLNGSGLTDVADVQCSVLLALWKLSLQGPLAQPPQCLSVPLPLADVDCDGAENVTDALLVVQFALGLPLASNIDADADDCPDACAAPPPKGPAPSLDGACFDERWVGQVQQGDTCPAPLPPPPDLGGSWHAERLFRTKVDAGQAFCVYEWQPSAASAGPALDLLPSDGARPPSEWLDRDCHAVATMAPADDVVDTVWTTLHETWLAQVGAPAELPPAQAPDGTLLPVPVAVALVDSATQTPVGTKDPGIGRSPHGRTVGLAIQELACPKGPGTPDCVAVFHNYVALPNLAPGVVDKTQGGYFGTFVSLSRSIEKALTDYQADPNAPPHLIINLSLGWDASYNTPDAPQEIRAGVLAIRHIIEQAVCDGALVVAAAGNRTGGPNEATGPMYPAAWEAHPAPPGCGTDGVYSPLVHAVGGVDDEDRPLTNSRPLARPRLVAPAFAVVVNDAFGKPEPPRPTPILTGSSLAAAVATAAAAVTWAYHPEWTAPEVMASVYASAVPLEPSGAPVAADFCMGSTPCPVTRRISLCGATLAALAPVDACSPACVDESALGCAIVPYAAGTNPDGAGLDFASLDALASQTVAFAPAGKAHWPFCPVPVVLADGAGAPANPCPPEQFYDPTLAPWAVVPLPGVHGCAHCYVAISSASDSAEAYLAIESDLATLGGIRDAVLDVDSSRAIDLMGALGVDHLDAGQTYRITDLPLSSLDVQRATLSFTVEGTDGETYATREELPVYAR